MSPPAPPLLLLPAAAALAGSAALANCALLAAVYRRTYNGLFAILAHLAVSDILILSTVSGPELWTYNAGSWPFGLIGCTAFQGLNIFASTASQYFTATIALHSLSTINLEENILHRKNKRSREEDEEMQSSRHSLVATSSDSSTPPRTMNIDYRVSNTQIRAAPPIVFVWILAASLSIPELTLSTTNRSESGTVTCCLADTAHRFNMQSLLAVFNVLIPLLMFSTTALLLFFKLIRKLPREIDKDSIASLKLSLCLIIVYCIMCLPRSVIIVLRSLSDDTMYTEGMNETFSLIKILFSIMYLTATLIRPVLCLILLPRLRDIMRGT